jgi:hypothetical protein
MMAIEIADQVGRGKFKRSPVLLHGNTITARFDPATTKSPICGDLASHPFRFQSTTDLLSQGADLACNPKKPIKRL